MISRIPKYFSDRIIRGSNATFKLAELAKDPNTRIETKKPNTKDYFPGQAPFIVLQDGDNEVWVEKDKWGTRVHATLVHDGKVAGTVDYHDNSWMKKYNDFGDKSPMMELQMNSMSYASVAASAALARALRPEHKAVYDKAEKEARAMRTEALGLYFKETGVVDKYAQVAELIKKDGPKELGDADITIKISKGKLVFDEHSSGAKYSVSLKGLKEGRFEADCRYMGKNEGKLVIGKDGKVTDDTAIGFAYNISFNSSWWITELLNGNEDL